MVAAADTPWAAVASFLEEKNVLYSSFPVVAFASFLGVVASFQEEEDESFPVVAFASSLEEVASFQEVVASYSVVEVEAKCLEVEVPFLVVVASSLVGVP